jgi:predicted O-methyltransferase YrrM
MSSYQENGLGLTLMNAVLQYRPVKIIEFGTLYGYSSIYMGMALRMLGRGHIYSYDLWETYQYKHTSMSSAYSNIIAHSLHNFVTLGHMDFFEWIKQPEPFDLLHLDISNDGDIIELALTRLAPFVNQGSIVLFEGGSKERDKVDWMVQYGKRPINPVLDKFGAKILDPRPPSLSIFKR